MNSMTGFGRASERGRQGDIEVEMRSVNHRHLSLKQSLPDGFDRYEPEIEQLVRGTLARGSVNLSVAFRRGPDAPPPMPDLDRVKAVHRHLNQVRKALRLEDDVELEDLLAIPALWSSDPPVDATKTWPKVRKLVQKALADLASRRRREGDSIARALRSHLEAIERRVDAVEKRVPAVVEAYQKRLDDRIQALLAQKGIESARVDVLKEVAIHADRCDVSEEIHRLRTHVIEFRKILGEPGEIGRRMDFLTQEMGRETNTIASKGNDAEISIAAVAIKAELEKIKEQVENVE